MLELLLCSLVTVLPDYLLRRQLQGKRWGAEINFFTVWYELRWGITLCAMLTIGLITIVFYYHPTTSNVASFFRTVTILSESSGRVAETYVEINQEVKAGDPIFRLDSSSQEAAAETARRQISEVDAGLELAKAQRAAALAVVDQARAGYQQTLEDFQRQTALRERGSTAVSERDVELLKNELGVRQGEVDAAQANVSAVDAQISVQLPAQRASAEAALAQAENEIEKLTVYAGVDGTIEQFTLRVGDIVSPVLRPAGILVPSEAGRNRFQAGFPQISAQVVKAGGVAEIMCASKPLTVVPMVIVEVQDVISSGQVRPSDRLADAQNQALPGTITAFLEPIYPGQTDDIPPGSRCLANAYTFNHDLLGDPSLGFGRWIFLHVVDTVGVVHAAGLRIRSLLLPLQTLVFSGH
ncbi:biotin/lipoyl-binding protein [Roseobacter sp. YSTF-M11]|uniref:Biotin/lipoyl-binding protein n=1 Tax=Roseobacter insulae TaxID=2859783 RepID=A0A9X1FTF9_9RHOB|nr:biotin/lipoyl-binding protein [Roseobacter insulae]MBW4707332.1 biotin/lipoyl-binding protein [Roseobacter insulae]